MNRCYQKTGLRPQFSLGIWAAGHILELFSPVLRNGDWEP